MQNNQFCKKSHLTNEAAVEALFVNPLLAELGYHPENILFKTSISEIAVGKGSKKVLYRPDYVLKILNIPAVVIDAKSPNEKIENWESQCSSYCLELNKNYDYNPVSFYILTNGLKLAVYKWDRNQSVLELDFQDFLTGNKKFEKLRKLIAIDSIRALAKSNLSTIENRKFTFRTANLDILSETFRKMHNLIWKAEKKSPSAAFQELIKVIFVKIEKDRQLHNKLGPNPQPTYKDVVFSSHWLSQQTENESPINDPLFRNLVRSLEKDILAGSKKRLFRADEELEISPSTILRLVKEIEHVDFFAMEEDIHGRMFEAFLDATVRGKDIGQFFTPRDIVELMVQLASPKVTKNSIDRVLDPCCGSGGFLIGCMRKMLQDASNLSGLTSAERSKIISTVKNKSLYGIDAGSDPAMYRIARMNMYLHGDGGSNIYYADSVDKKIGRVGSGSNENERQIDEIRNLVKTNNFKFDIILSNPPFSLSYSRDDPEQSEILNQFSLSADRGNGKIVQQLPTSVLFLERYRDLIKDNGTIAAIIDDSILSGESFAYIRDYMRDNFIIKGVISLPGDAFQRSAARVKTSILLLRPKKGDETQSDVFVWAAVYLGIEAKTAKRIGIDTDTLENEKLVEIQQIISSYEKYNEGEVGDYSVSFENLKDRMDAKYCINDRGRKHGTWEKNGFGTTVISNVLDLQSNRKESVKNELEYQMLRVSYEGDILDGDIVTGAESSYSNLQKVETFDILVSNIGFGRGAVGIVPSYHSNKWVSSEYTILKAASKEEAVFYTSLLRTKEILGDVLASTTGMNRGRIKWDVISSVIVPEYVSGTKDIEVLVKELEIFWSSYEAFTKKHHAHVSALTQRLEVNNSDSQKRWLAFKPPE
ncbi:MAG: N-6 DNA methylase [Lentilitoribacter sp.]